MDKGTLQLGNITKDIHAPQGCGVSQPRSRFGPTALIGRSHELQHRCYMINCWMHLFKTHEVLHQINPGTGTPGYT